jgi:hypothetical protein
LIELSDGAVSMLSGRRLQKFPDGRPTPSPHPNFSLTFSA